MSNAKRGAARDRLEPGLREIKLVIPDARSDVVRRRVAASSAGLSSEAEDEALRWIEAVSVFDEPDFGHEG